MPSVGLRQDAALGRSRPAAVQLQRDGARVQPRREPAPHQGGTEAYLDLETLDHRLWLRLGLQTIISGKTEVFRTTDQFNPQDLGLSSLPSLEESRIALWSARGGGTRSTTWVRSRTCASSWRANLDEFEPGRSRRGAASPMPPDFVCTLTNGDRHALLSRRSGSPASSRPESPWKDISDSSRSAGGSSGAGIASASRSPTSGGTAICPYADAIFFYERGVDTATGRPVIARLPGQTLGTCASGGQIAPDPVNKPSATSPGIAYSTAFASHPYSVTTAQEPYALSGAGTVDTLPDGSPLDGGTAIRGGIGSDPDCLRPGGAPGCRECVLARPSQVRRGDQRAPVPVVESADLRVDLPRDGRDRRGARARRVRVDVLHERRQSAQRGGVPVGEAFVVRVRGRSRQLYHPPLHAGRAQFPEGCGAQMGR